MKHLSRIMIIVMLIVVTGGVVPAAASKPDPVSPTVTVGLSDAFCVTDGGLEATATVEITPTDARLTDFHMYVEKIGIVSTADIAYAPSVRDEAWNFYWWTGGGDMPLTWFEGSYQYVLKTNDLQGESWIQYHKVLSPALASTDFYLVSVFASAATSKGKGGGANQFRDWDDNSWTVNCTEGANPAPSLNRVFEYCWLDAEGVWHPDSDTCNPL